MKKLNVLFVHDHVFQRSEGEYYSEGKITNRVFSRYKVCTDNIRVLSRCAEANKVERLVKVTDPMVSFIPVRGVSFFKIFTVNLVGNLALVFRASRDADFAIIRLPSFLGVFASFVFIFMRKPFFIEMVGHAGEAIRMSRKRGVTVSLFSRFFDFLVRYVTSKCHGVVYVTKAYLQSYYPNNKMVEYASNVELNLSAAPEPVRRLSKNNGPIIVGLIGSFKNSYKGIDVAIKSICHLRGLGVDCELRVLGSGDKSPYLALAKSLKVEDGVFFDGIREGGVEVFNWLDGLDIYVQPSLTEGLPRSLIEAMSRALPCVASTVGGMPELLEPDWLCPPTDFASLAEKMYRLSTNQQLSNAVGQRNYLAAQEYDMEILSARRSQFWKKAGEHVHALKRC